MAKHKRVSGLVYILLAMLLVVPVLNCAPSTQPAPTQPTAIAPTQAAGAAPTQSAATAPARPTATAPPARAKKLTAPEIAMLELNPERQKILEAGAKAEGELMFYTSSSGLEPVAAAFMKKYPFIATEVFQANTPSLIERTRAEVAANRLGGDIVSGGLRSFIPLSEFMTPFKSPGANFSVFPKGAVNHLTFIIFAYNTKLVAANEIPQKIDDLLLPRWKGKIGFHGPPNTFPGLITGMLIETLGEEQATNFLKKLGDQNLFLYQTGGVGMQALTSGETHIGTQSHSSVVEAKKSGAPVNFVALDPTMTTVSLIGIFEKTQHPYSAMLFIDFMLSPDGQKVLREEGNYASMQEVERGEAWGVKLPKKIRFESPEDEKKTRTWNDKFNQLAAKKK